MASLDVYELGNATALGSLSPSSGDWNHRANEHGAGRCVVNGAISSALLAPDTYIRVNDGTRDTFAFVPTSKPRGQVGASTEVELSGPGLRHFLTRAPILPEDTSDCADPTSVRALGWMSKILDTSAKDDVLSFGRWVTQPFSTPRPEAFPDIQAELVTVSLSPSQAGDSYLWWDVTFATEQDAVFCAGADDEFELWFRGVKMISTIGRGPNRWKTYETSKQIRVCPGTYRVAVKLRNLERAIAATNYTWLIWSLVTPGGDGLPQSANQTWEISTDAESGTIEVDIPHDFPLTTVSWSVGDSASTVLAALEAELGAGNVTVDGAGTAAKNEAYDLRHDATGGTLDLTVEGELRSGIAHNASPATVKTEVEAALAAAGFTGDATVTVGGSWTVGDPLRIEFTGDAVKEQSISLSVNMSGLTGGSVREDTNIQDGTEYDPTVIEFTGTLANQAILVQQGSGTSLTGGTLTIIEGQRGQSATAIARSDTSGKMAAYPATTPGLTPRRMVRQVWEEETARGDTPLDHLTLGGTDTEDADGNTWGEYNVELGLSNATVDRLIEVLIEAGTHWDFDPDGTLQPWATRGTDLTGSVAYTEGDGSTIRRAGRDESAIVNVLRYLTDEGWKEATDATSISTYMRAAGTTRLEEYSDADASQFTAPLLADLKDPQEAVEIEVPAEHAVLPYDDFDMADEISVPAWSTSGLTARDVRILEIGGRIDGASHVWRLRGTT